MIESAVLESRVVSRGVKITYKNFGVYADSRPRLPNVLKVGEKYAFKVPESEQIEGTRHLVFNGKKVGIVKVMERTCFDGTKYGRFEIKSLKYREKSLEIR